METNEEKAKEIAEESKQFFYHDEYECGLACAIRMAKWKDEQFAVLLKSELATWQGNSAEAKYRREMLKELLEKLK